MEDINIMTFTAKEARKLMDEHPSKQKEVEDILQQIREDIHEDPQTNHLYYYEVMMNTTIEKLKEMGYGVENQSNQRDGVGYKISW